MEAASWEKYGACGTQVMLAFTLAALIVMGQKGVHRDAGDSTLLGSSLFAAFVLWLILTTYLYGAAKVRAVTVDHGGYR